MFHSSCNNEKNAASDKPTSQSAIKPASKKSKKRQDSAYKEGYRKKVSFLVVYRARSSTSHAELFLPDAVNYGEKPHEVLNERPSLFAEIAPFTKVY